MCQRAFRSTVWLSICQEKRCGRSLLRGDRGGSRSGPRGFRAPELRRRQAAIEKELEGVALQALEKTRLTQLNASMENFLAALQQSAKTLEIVDRQKIIRLVTKQIIVNGDTLTIHHSIPISRSSQESQPSTSYLLCTRSRESTAIKYLPGRTGLADGPQRL